ncbi:YfiR family protein [Psychromonas sp. GE-S-Ul-11]|uniref:YfiR family protein n=1 Tax=Psychromonas sp. GE-S-Ul-11 TaxID=3241170 RepID=UPI00390C7FE5
MANSREDAIKSGFIYNFARYSQGSWFNASQQNSYNICSFNPDFIVSAAKTLKALSIENRPVELVLLTDDNPSLTNCNTLFISKADADVWHAISKNEVISSLMLVGEFDGFLSSGGHINFFIISGKVRFEVSPSRLRKSGIKMSSKVLRLGRIYQGGEQ